MIAPRQHWRDALDLHTAQTRWCESEVGRRMLALHAEEIVREFTADGTGTARDIVRGLYANQGAALAGATPFFVSADMCELVAHASVSFQPEPIYPTDVLDLNGFMYFEKPIVIPDRFDRDVEIAAVSWTVLMDADKTVEKTRALTRDDEFREFLEQRHQDGLMDGLGLTLWERMDTSDWAAGPKPPLVPLHVTPWWWGLQFQGNEMTAEGRPSGSEHWWKIVQTTWRLMAQTITARRRQGLPRPARRERQRFGYRFEDIVVVTLRREGSPAAEPSGEEAHYSHRFIRHGHWRNQYYPSQGIHRQIFIADMVVGPEDKPLIIKPRAYSWTR